MQFKQTPEQQARDLRFYVLEGVFWAIMYYLGIIFLVPYLISYNANTMQIGLLNTLPIFIASFFALLSYQFLKYFKSEKQFALFFAIIQAALWIPLAFIGYLFNDQLVIWLVIIIYCLIITLEQLPFAVYREWIGRVFNTKHIVEYNSQKQIILNLVSILPLFLAGILLDTINKSNVIIGFTIIFIVVATFRFLSAIMISKMSQTETSEELQKESKELNKPVFKIFKNEVLKDKQFKYFLIITSLVYLGMHIAAPFYRYYFLEVLNFSYKQYIFLEIGVILGLVLSFFYWGKICDKYGSTKVLKAIILFLPIYPLMVILFGNNPWLLFLLNVFDGAIMAGFALGIFGYFYQNIKEDIIHHMAFFMIFQSLAMLIGTLIGGYISSNPRFWYEGLEKNGLLLIFLISMMFRIFTIGFVSKIKDTSRVKINLPKNILLQKPIIFGLNKFLNFTKDEGKILAKRLYDERMELTKELQKEEKSIRQNIKKLVVKEKELFKEISKLQDKDKNTKLKEKNVFGKAKKHRK